MIDVARVVELVSRPDASVEFQRLALSKHRRHLAVRDVQAHPDAGTRFEFQQKLVAVRRQR
jgi:hypothetical protein